MFADALLAAYLPCPTVDVIHYAWAHGGAPDERDVTGRGSFSLVTGEGTMEFAMFSARHVEEGDARSRSEAGRRMIRALSKPVMMSASVSDRVLLGWHPLWWVEVLRGVRVDFPSGALPERLVWAGVTDLLLARRHSRGRLDVSLPVVDLVPWSAARAWRRRQPVRVEGSRGMLFIALQECGSVSAWSAVRLECGSELRDGVRVEK